MKTRLPQNLFQIKYQLITCIIILALFSNNYYAQCNSCTSTLSGNSMISIIDRVVSNDEVFCIKPTGKLTRNLHIMGGVVCNNGTISINHMSIQNGGILINYGTIEIIKTPNENGSLMFTKGKIINHGIININYIHMRAGDFINNNIANINRMSLEINGNNNYTINNGVIKGESFYSSTIDTSFRYNFNNSGSIHLNSHLRNSSSMTFENKGNLSIGDIGELNFQNHYGGIFINTGEMSVSGIFSNSGDFYTDCMIPIGGDAQIHGKTNGPLQNSCGGFNVAGYIQLGGDVGTDNSYLDFCEQNNSGGIHQNYPNEIGTNISFCSCNNECGPIDVFEDFVGTNNYSLYPNPLSNTSVLKFYNPVESFHTLVIYDLYGRVAKTQEGVFGDQITINKEGLNRGIYFFKIASTYNIKAAGKLMVN